MTSTFLDTVIKAFRGDANRMVFQEREREILVKGREFLADTVWRPLNEMVMLEFGGRYTPSEKGWVIPKPKMEEPTRTGIPTIDAKLKDMEREQEAAEAELVSVNPTETEESLTGKILLMDVDQIQTNPYNPNEMRDDEFKALVENMRREGPHGTSPIEIRPLKRGAR
jgi:co-chaperonin GroES (HSP10)